MDLYLSLGYYKVTVHSTVKLWRCTIKLVRCPVKLARYAVRCGVSCLVRFAPGANVLEAMDTSMVPVDLTNQSPFGN